MTDLKQKQNLNAEAPCGTSPVTPSGVDAPRVVTADMVPHGASELPGDYPFTRGIFPDGFRGRAWTMRQYSGFGTAEESTRAISSCCARGRRASR